MTATRLAIGALAASLLLVGCGAQSASPSPATSAGTAGVPSAPSIAPSLVSSPAATLAMPSGASVVRDPSLLGLLPASIGGVAVKEETGSLSEAVSDPAFVASVDRAAYATAVSSADIASGVIAHLRAGVYSDQMFSDWRSSYDEGACAQADGVVAHANETQGARTIYVTTCGAGLRVYHTYLAKQDVIVSLLSTGSQDFGAQLMAGIRG